VVGVSGQYLAEHRYDGRFLTQHRTDHYSLALRGGRCCGGASGDRDSGPATAHGSIVAGSEQGGDVLRSVRMQIRWQISFFGTRRTYEGVHADAEPWMKSDSKPPSPKNKTSEVYRSRPPKLLIAAFRAGIRSAAGVPFIWARRNAGHVHLGDWFRNAKVRVELDRSVSYTHDSL